MLQCVDNLDPDGLLLLKMIFGQRKLDYMYMFGRKRRELQVVHRLISVARSLVTFNLVISVSWIVQYKLN